MSFSTIPVRSNGEDITYSWFNLLRTAGVAVEAFLGSGYVGETSETLANNQSAAADVTGLIFASASVKSAVITAEVRRKTSTTEYVSVGRLLARYLALSSTWEVTDELSGDDDGVEFTITAAGQIQYTSDNMSGTGYTGSIRFRAITFGG